jgi:hypothetical protein
MSKKISPIKPCGWDEAIEDAKRRMEQLRRTIAICDEKKAKGEPLARKAIKGPNRKAAAQRLRHYPLVQSGLLMLVIASLEEFGVHEREDFHRPDFHRPSARIQLCPDCRGIVTEISF